MITDKSTPDEIIKSMLSDHSHVEYMVKKSYGGSAKYRAASERMMEECRRDRKSFLLGNIEHYRSGFTGNNWIAYHYCKAVQNDVIYNSIGSFVYWDTDDGSIAAAVTVTSSKSKQRLAVIYTGHFFQRYVEREQLGTLDLDVVCNFFYNNTCPLIQLDPDEQDGEHRFDLALHRGIGRGHTIGYNTDNKASIYRVKTYLPNSMLNATQREQTAYARDRRAGVDRPIDALCNAFFDHDEEHLCELCDDIYRAKGMEPGFGRQVGGLLLHIVGIGVCKDCTNPNPNFRKLFFDVYNQYISSIFEYVYRFNKKTYDYRDMIAICKLANPDFNVDYVLLYAMSYLIDTDNPITSIDKRVLFSLVEKVNQGIDITSDIRLLFPEILNIIE